MTNIKNIAFSNVLSVVIHKYTNEGNSLVYLDDFKSVAVLMIDYILKNFVDKDGKKLDKDSLINTIRPMVNEVCRNYINNNNEKESKIDEVPQLLDYIYSSFVLHAIYSNIENEEWEEEICEIVVLNMWVQLTSDENEIKLIGNIDNGELVN